MASFATINMLQVSLGFRMLSPELENVLANKIDTAIARLEKNGVRNLREDNADDIDLIVMYAEYLYKRRNSDNEMPKMLRAAINDRKVHDGVEVAP